VIVEPLIESRTANDWPDIVSLAERQDSILFQNRQYPAGSGQRPSKAAAAAATVAMELRPTTKFIQRSFKPKAKNSQPQSSPQKNNESERLRREKRYFYYCKEAGHFMRNYPKKGRGYRSARTARIHQEDETTTLKEYMAQRTKPSMAAAISDSDKMVATFKCGNKYGPFLYRTQVQREQT
jgi:hypothetical protein